MEQKPKSNKMRPAKQRQEGAKSREQWTSQAALSSAELVVLSAFRKYLMTPGKMLCFSGSDLEAFKVPLMTLTKKRLLVAERFHGGYSLTTIGFAAMKNA